ncbi:unnamed protein product [Vitrella brassicaformis CCMP3155]|uniref:Uncharacterized protein n=2 Tax=Vitrella brassicaformis TaxID=1169539 RepID=A0A0G4EH74_VITBC|nr:unnamed protein product [Vitrella brassicaformis CCMP3155]|eukprot:CEL95327.1 unnamed protein product [Vitrella brassicaformis CCMP3155]
MALTFDVAAPFLLFTVLNSTQNLVLSLITALTRVKTGVLFGTGEETGEALAGGTSREASLQLLTRSRAHGNHTEMMTVHLFLLLGLTIAAAVEGPTVGITKVALYSYGAIFFTLKTMHVHAHLQPDSYKAPNQPFRTIGYVGNWLLMVVMAGHLLLAWLKKENIF